MDPEEAPTDPSDMKVHLLDVREFGKVEKLVRRLDTVYIRRTISVSTRSG